MCFIIVIIIIVETYRDWTQVPPSSFFMSQALTMAQVGQDLTV